MYTIVGRSLTFAVVLSGVLAALLGVDARAQETSSAARAQTTGQAPSEGVDLYYHTYGAEDGPPVLILNGGPGISSEHFAPLARQVGELGAGYRAILFDQRGTGRSPLAAVDSSTVNVDLMVEDIEALRAHLGIEAWTVMGHSWGGMYGMLYATRHPERVRGLILSSSGGADLEWLRYIGANLRMRMGPERRAAFERALDPAYAEADPERANRDRVEAMAAAYVYDPAHIPFVVEALTRPGANFPEVRGLVWADLQRVGYDLHEELRSFPEPALLLSGRQDIIGDEVPLRIHASLPHSELVWLNESSHYPWLDQPDAYFEAIDGFLRRVTRRTP
jgi:proline iminopeptidase